MKGKNSKDRYQTFYFDFKDREWKPAATFRTMSEVAKAFQLSEGTCRKIFKRRGSSYENFFKIKKIEV